MVQIERDRKNIMFDMATIINSNELHFLMWYQSQYNRMSQVDIRYDEKIYTVTMHTFNLKCYYVIRDRILQC